MNTDKELFKALLTLRETHSRIELASKVLETSRTKDHVACLVLESLQHSKRLLLEGYEQVKHVYLSDKSEELRKTHKEWPPQD